MAQPKETNPLGQNRDTLSPPEKFLEIARRGRDNWNAWLGDNPEERANFHGIDFTVPENKGICFAGFAFGDDANFSNTTFGDAPVSYRINAENAAAVGERAEGSAIFIGAAFGERANFNKAKFGDRANFTGVAFGKWANFADTAFGDEARFNGAAFGTDASFARAFLGENIKFTNAAFEDRARFDGASFAGETSFGVDKLAPVRKTYVGYANNLTEPQKGSYLSAMNTADRAGFNDITFSRARFGGVANFTGRTLIGSTDFSRANFLQPPDFSGTEGQNNFDWTRARFGFQGKVRSMTTRGWTADTETVTKLRRLRKIASEIHAHDAERDLFILERMAERGIGWSDWWQRSNEPGLKGLLIHLFGWGHVLIATTLMAIYRVSSNCGRSVFLPLTWLVATSTGFFFWYRGLVAASAIAKQGTDTIRDSLISFTLSNALPFVGSSRQVTKNAIEKLFGESMPGAVYGITLFQGLLSILLLFLVGLALRAHFKVR